MVDSVIGTTSWTCERAERIAWRHVAAKTCSTQVRGYLNHGQELRRVTNGSRDDAVDQLVMEAPERWDKP